MLSVIVGALKLAFSLGAVSELIFTKIIWTGRWENGARETLGEAVVITDLKRQAP